MMGNAAIQAAERARELLARRPVARSSTSRATASSSPSAACSTPRTPDKGVTLPGSGHARRGRVRHDRHGRLLHAAAARRPGTRAAASARRRRTRYTAAVVEVEVDPRHGLDRRAEGLDRPRHRPRAEPDAGARPGRGQRLHGPRRGADGGAGVSGGCRRDCRDALVHKFPSMLEYKSPTTLEMPEVVTELVEDPDPRRPVRRQGSRPGAAAPDHAGAWPTPSTTPSACASTRCRSRPRRS